MSLYQIIPASWTERRSLGTNKILDKTGRTLFRNHCANRKSTPAAVTAKNPSELNRIPRARTQSCLRHGHAGNRFSLIFAHVPCQYATVKHPFPTVTARANRWNDQTVYTVIRDTWNERGEKRLRVSRGPFEKSMGRRCADQIITRLAVRMRISHRTLKEDGDDAPSLSASRWTTGGGDRDNNGNHGMSAREIRCGRTGWKLKNSPRFVIVTWFSLLPSLLPFPVRRRARRCPVYTHAHIYLYGRAAAYKILYEILVPKQRFVNAEPSVFRDDVARLT